MTSRSIRIIPSRNILALADAAIERCRVAHRHKLCRACVCDNFDVSWRTIRETFWSVDALLFVVIFNALLLLVPRMKTRLPVTGR
jgi:hypothetical protein